MDKTRLQRSSSVNCASSTAPISLFIFLRLLFVFLRAIRNDVYRLTIPRAKAAAEQAGGKEYKRSDSEHAFDPVYLLNLYIF